MSTSSLPLEHPLLAAVRMMGDALDDTVLSDPMFLSTSQRSELLLAIMFWRLGEQGRSV